MSGELDARATAGPNTYGRMRREARQRKAASAGWSRPACTDHGALG